VRLVRRKPLLPSICPVYRFRYVPVPPQLDELKQTMCSNVTHPGQHVSHGSKSCSERLVRGFEIRQPPHVLRAWQHCGQCHPTQVIAPCHAENTDALWNREVKGKVLDHATSNHSSSSTQPRHEYVWQHHTTNCNKTWTSQQQSLPEMLNCAGHSRKPFD
jgi:hypothetical protein